MASNIFTGSDNKLRVLALEITTLNDEFRRGGRFIGTESTIL